MILDTCSVIAGTFLLCLSVQMFLLPYDILSGGVAGLGVALYPWIHVNPTFVANFLTVVLLVVGSFVLGKDFFVNTALSSLLYPVFNMILERTLNIPDITPAMASFYGGLVGGAGVGIVMRTGASTGGMDVPPLIIHELTDIPVSTLVMVVDGTTVLLGFFSHGLEDVLVGLISVFASTVAVNRILALGQGSAGKEVQIISDHWQEITRDITQQLQRSTTVLSAQGGFSGENKKLLVAVVTKTQYRDLIAIVRQYDPTAFVITTEVSDMHGEGWTYTLI